MEQSAEAFREAVYRLYGPTSSFQIEDLLKQVELKDSLKNLMRGLLGSDPRFLSLDGAAFVRFCLFLSRLSGCLSQFRSLIGLNGSIDCLRGDCS